ncbi:MAG: phosphatase PAP2 family protein [Myxococcota bacterium]
MDHDKLQSEPSEVELAQDASASPEPLPPRSAWRSLLQIRPEEVLVLAVVALFAWLQSHHYLHFQFATNFIKAGVKLFAIAAGLFVVVRLVERVRARQFHLRGVGGLMLDAVGFVRDWAPMVLLLSAYENALSLVAKVSPRLADMEIFQLDQLIFSGHPDMELQVLARPWVNETLALCYDSLYVYPVVLGMWLLIRGRRMDAREYMASFVLAGYVGWVGYAIVPAVGPRYYFGGVHEAATQAGGYFYDVALRFSSHQAYGGILPRNCFPSLHTAWAVVTLVFLWRKARWLFWVLCLPLLGLICATVFLRFHYASDLLAGIAVATLVVTLVPRALTGWERTRLGPNHPDALVAPPPLGGWRIALQLALPVLFLAATTGWLVNRASKDSPQNTERDALVAAAQLHGEPKPQFPVGAKFGLDGGAIELIGVDLDPPHPLIGRSVKVTLYWRCLRELPGGWQPFVHLDDKDGRHVNWDHDPVWGLLPVHDWRPGQIIRDSGWIDIPRRLLPGPGTVNIGLWHRPDLRLPVANPKQVTSDPKNRVRAAVFPLTVAPL